MKDFTQGRFVSHIRKIPDFPHQGILFYDLIPALADSESFQEVITALDSSTPSADIIAGVEARGFLFAAALAQRRSSGLLAIRKAGKLPPPVASRVYQLEYGSAQIEIPAEGIDIENRTIVLVDDLLATGGTLAAAAGLLRERGATVLAAASIVELLALSGREALARAGIKVITLVNDEHLRSSGV